MLHPAAVGLLWFKSRARDNRVDNLMLIEQHSPDFGCTSISCQNMEGDDAHPWINPTPVWTKTQDSAIKSRVWQDQKTRSIGKHFPNPLSTYRLIHATLKRHSQQPQQYPEQQDFRISWHCASERLWFTLRLTLFSHKCFMLHVHLFSVFLPDICFYSYYFI